jgi:hypothetical protein
MPEQDQEWTQTISTIYKNDAIIKFHTPDYLKQLLEKQALKRNISLSAFMRLIASEYLRRKQPL